MITQGRKILGLWLFAALLICCMSLTSCSENDNSGGSSPESEVEEMLRKMTLREKVGQLFFVRPEALDPDNIIIGKRAFSDDPAVAAPMVVNYLQGLKDAVVKAVENGTISETRLNDSVRRILMLKYLKK